MGGDPTQYESNEYAARGELQNQHFAKTDVGNLGKFRVPGASVPVDKLFRLGYMG